MLNFLKKLNNSTYLINSCPLCKSKKFKYYKFFYFNRYTDEFSNLIKVQPDYLMKNIQQKACIKCNLIFKKRWFKRNILRKIYNNQAPFVLRVSNVPSSLFSTNLGKRIGLMCLGGCCVPYIFSQYAVWSILTVNRVATYRSA